MKLLQINDNTYINPDMVIGIVRTNDYPHYSGMNDNNIKVPEKTIIYLRDMTQVQLDMTPIQVMSKICEEVYYGDDGICKEDK